MAVEPQDAPGRGATGDELVELRCRCWFRGWTLLLDADAVVAGADGPRAVEPLAVGVGVWSE
ncbi:MAG TPA: hypothetical protein VFU94_12560, partial [Conexibacter sp.]|nr:hypothetical protein [Conexibacter sp.]